VGSLELNRLLSDVRRRVEHEITFEGCERRIKYVVSLSVQTKSSIRPFSFVSALLPSTAETLQHALIQGGVSPADIRQISKTAAFHSLLEETRSQILSSNFACVLEGALDRATAILFEGLEENVFVESTVDNSASGDELKFRLVGLLPGLARWSHLALNRLPNALVEVRLCHLFFFGLVSLLTVSNTQGIIGLREVSALSAVLFAEYLDRFR
jgi:peroxin-3